MENTALIITEEKIKNMGIETVAKFAGSIYANYLSYMNGGLQGYSFKDILKMKKGESDRVKKIFDEYVKDVAKAINEPDNPNDTATDKFLKKSYIEWFT